MHEAFRGLLTEDAAVTAQVGDRITWGLIPQAAADPAISMHEISAVPIYTMAGEDGLVVSRVQVDVRGRTYAAAMMAARAVRARLTGFSGVKGGTQFQGIFVAQGRSYSEKPGDRVYHTISLDFEVHSKPAA